MHDLSQGSYDFIYEPTRFMRADPLSKITLTAEKTRNAQNLLRLMSLQDFERDFERELKNPSLGVRNLPRNRSQKNIKPSTKN